MQHEGGVILTINAGSSSVKFALFDASSPLGEIVRGQVSGIGGTAELKLAGRAAEQKPGAIHSHQDALGAILKACAPHLAGRPVVAVGHRVVHGGVRFKSATRLDAAAIDAIEALVPLAPLHQPHNLAGIRAAQAAFPEAVQVGCFDTAFHQTQPDAYATYAIPGAYAEKGVRRYGFHGLSYSHVAKALRDIDPVMAEGRVIIAHLGNGASMCGLKNGQSQASSMGFSVLDGLVMGTRPGSIDPGVLLWLMESEGLNAKEISDLLYRQSGLLGLSGLSNDMRVLEGSDDPAARHAIAYFAEMARRQIGMLAASLGGLDALVFCGGIGENSPRIRSDICAGMEWLGITLDANANRSSRTEIGSGPTQVLVIPTDEEHMIARSAFACLEA